MNKQEFITLLEKRLFQLPQVEKEHLLNYYNETIEDRIEDGMSETEAVSSLDSIEAIVKQVYAERNIQMEEEVPVKSRRGWNDAFKCIICFISDAVGPDCSPVLYHAGVCMLYCRGALESDTDMESKRSACPRPAWQHLSFHRSASAVLETPAHFRFMAE